MTTTHLYSELPGQVAPHRKSYHRNLVGWDDDTIGTPRLYYRPHTVFLELHCDGVQLHPFMGVPGAGEESSFLSLSLGEKGGRHSMIDSHAGAIPRWEGG